MVGSAFDLSATFYNPGALALAEDPRFTFSLDALEISQVRIPNGAGPGLDFRSRNLEFAPSFVSGLLGSGTGKQRIAFAILTRQDLRFRLGARRDITSTPTGRSFTGSARIDQNAKEYWAGGTWSTKLNDRVGFGVSTFLALRSQRTFTQVIADLVEPNGDGSSVQLTDEYRYNHLRVLWKLGVSYRPTDTLSLGVTVTTPGAGLFGDGKSDVQSAIINLDLDGDGQSQSELASGLQRNLNVSYNSPLSIALGMRYQRRDTTLHFTTEWFDSVDPFTVMSPDPVESRPSGESFSTILNHSLRSITNAGLGVEHRFSKKFTAYGAVMRDASAAVRDPELNHSFATWNLTHLTAGIRVGEPDRAWTLGFGYAWGDDSRTSLIDLSERGPLPGIEETPATVEAFFARWKIIFGFQLGTK